MKIKLISIGIIALLLIVGLSGCTQQTDKSDQSFIGSWRGKGIKHMKFSSDNSCVFSGMDYTWSISNQQLTLKSSNGAEVTYDYSFSDDYNTLTLTNIISQDIDNYTRE